MYISETLKRIGMTTIKSYTDLEQSRKLAEFLPLESADMYYEPSAGFCTEPSEAKFGNIKYAHPRSIRCWSLAALLSILPEIQGGKPVIALDDNYITYPHMSDLHTKADNLVDACVAMIESLHELNLL
jgi:hypothetical protein